MKVNAGKNNNFILGACIFTIALLIMFILIPNQTTSHVTRVGFGARTFPRFLMVTISALSIIMAINSYFKPEQDHLMATKKELTGALQIVSILIVSVLLMNHLGLYVTFALAIFTAQWLLGARKIRTMVISVSGFCLCIYLIMEVGMKIRMPRGFFTGLF